MWPKSWIIDKTGESTILGFARDRIIAKKKTDFQEMELIHNKDWGKMLFLDGKIQSAQKDEFIYHEALTHLPLLIHPNPKEVWIIGGGEGATLREVLEHQTIKKVVMIDIDKELVNFCNTHMKEWHQGSFNRPETELVFADARDWITKTDRKADVIIIDLTEPIDGGPSVFLFTKEMYELIYNALNPDGVISSQIGSASINGTFMPCVLKTIQSIFPKVLPYTTFIPSFSENWGFMLAEKNPNLHFSISLMAERMVQRLKKPARQFLTPWIIYTMFLLPVYLEKKLDEEGRILTDIDPYISSNVKGHRF